MNRIIACIALAAAVFSAASRNASAATAVAAASAPSAGADPAGTRVKRFALAVGSAFGGAGRDTLLYAASDAAGFAKVLEDMGGVPQANTRVLSDPAPRDLEKALEKLRQDVQAAQTPGMRTEVVVYYSGHADDKGLLLGDRPYEYDRFRRGIDSIPAHVRIAVLDACASGAITRLKGGRRRPAFTVDAASDMRGYAFLTSSSPEEASQESDQLGSSFFTHYLVSGLRGAADVSGDGKVTLGEAYQFAFNETLARTERTKGGPQHPAYDMKLSGTGDVVMTDLRETSAGLTLGTELEGRFFVRVPAGQLIAEVYKPRGRAMELGLPPGRYEVRWDGGRTPMAAAVELENGGRRPLAAGDFRGAEPDLAAYRGKGGPGGQEGPAGAEASASLTAQGEDSSPGARMEVRDQMDLSLGRGGPRKFTFSLGFLFNHQRDPFRGLQLALFVNHASRGMQGAQISVLNNGAGGAIEGAQLSAIGNWGLDSLRGLQISPIFNVAAGPVTGGQGSAVLNVSGPVDGGQGSAVANIAAGPVTGGQGAAVMNVAWGKVDGAQASAVLNVARGVKGGQVSAVANIAAGDVEGAQASAVLNAARDVRGVQATAVLNAARDVRGVQVSATLNAAHDVEGWQIGVCNISHDIRGGQPFGMFNYSHTGLHSLNLSNDELGFQTVTLLSGGRNFYTYYTAGEKLQTRGNQFMLGGGIGVQFPLPGRPWFGAADLGVQDFHYDYDFDGEGPELYRLKLTAGRALLPYVSAFGGLSLNAYWHQQGEPLILPWGDYRMHLGGSVYGWPGLFLGIRLGR